MGGQEKKVVFTTFPLLAGCKWWTKSKSKAQLLFDGGNKKRSGNVLNAETESTQHTV